MLTAPPTALAGESFLVRIEPFDASGNLITEFRGKAGVFAVNVSGGGEVVPAKLRSEEFAGGATVKVASRRAGILELTVTEGEGSTPLASVQARILPNRLDRFVVNAPREVTAGEAFQARVIAQDAYGNTKDDLADVRERSAAGDPGDGLGRGRRQDRCRPSAGGRRRSRSSRARPVRSASPSRRRGRAARARARPSRSIPRRSITSPCSAPRRRWRARSSSS